MRMIDAAKFTMSRLPGTEVCAISLSEPVDIDLQLSEIKEVNFDITLLSHLSDLTEGEALELSAILPVEPERLLTA